MADYRPVVVDYLRQLIDHAEDLLARVQAALPRLSTEQLQEILDDVNDCHRHLNDAGEALDEPPDDEEPA